MTTRNELHINSALQLLQARKEALDQINRAPMRAHGKVLGKDVFTWFDYKIDDLVNTILSFPYPVHWIAKKGEVKQAFKHSKSLVEKFRTIAIYDSARFELSQEVADVITNCISADSLEGALTMMKAVEQEKSVLLITGDMTDWESNKQHIEQFIDSYKR